MGSDSSLFSSISRGEFALEKRFEYDFVLMAGQRSMAKDQT